MYMMSQAREIRNATKCIGPSRLAWNVLLLCTKNDVDTSVKYPGPSKEGGISRRRLLQLNLCPEINIIIVDYEFAFVGLPGDVYLVK